jgi:hypothetical protein
MRRNPLVILAALGSFYAYYLMREAGHLIAGLMIGREVRALFMYRIIPRIAVDLQASRPTVREQALVIVSGPLAALVLGYILLVLIVRWGRTLHRSMHLLLGFACYLCLVLDPIYYAVIPLLRLGGEPQSLAALLGYSVPAMIAIAVGLLILNIALVRRKVVPLIRRRGHS